jgi:hypothetical protein
MIIFTPVTGGITDKRMNICDTCAAIELEKNLLHVLFNIRVCLILAELELLMICCNLLSVNIYILFHLLY